MDVMEGPLPSRGVSQCVRGSCRPYGSFLSVFLAVIAGLLVYDLLLVPRIHDTELSDTLSGQETFSLSGDHPYCNVRAIALHGVLVTYIPLGNESNPDSTGDIVSSEDVTEAIADAEKDPVIKAILLEVDSGGGEPVAAEEIARALSHATKPTVAVIRTIGASAAYWSATGAGRIFASANSDVGSIGVTSSFAQESNKGREFIQLSSGKFKDTGNPDKPITEEEKALLMRDVNIIYENFIQSVATNRHLSVDDVRKVADGSTVLGATAKELKLIDEIGGLPDAEAYIEGLIGQKPVLCWE